MKMKEKKHKKLKKENLWIKRKNEKISHEKQSSFF